MRELWAVSSLACVGMAWARTKPTNLEELILRFSCWKRELHLEPIVAEQLARSQINIIFMGLAGF